MNLSLTGYPQGPHWVHQPDWTITVLSASMCNTKKQALASEEAAAEEKPLLTPYEQIYLHSYAQKVYIHQGTWESIPTQNGLG